MNENGGKNVLLSVLGVAILVVAVVGISFAAFTFTGPGTKDNTISTGTILMTYTEGTNAINITNAMPLTETEGKAQSTTAPYCSVAAHADRTACENAGATWNETNVYTFTVDAAITGTTNINYEVSVRPANDGKGYTAIADTNIQLYLEKSSTLDGTYVGTAEGVIDMTSRLAAESAVGSPANSKIIDHGEFTGSATNYYKLRMWIKSGTVMTGATQGYTVLVDVNAKNAY